MPEEVTVAMIEAARRACFDFHHPGKRPHEVAWVAPSIGLVKTMLKAALNAAPSGHGERG